MRAAEDVMQLGFFAEKLGQEFGKLTEFVKNLPDKFAIEEREGRKMLEEGFFLRKNGVDMGEFTFNYGPTVVHVKQNGTTLLKVEGGKSEGNERLAKAFVSQFSSKAIQFRSSMARQIEEYEARLLKELEEF